MDKLTREILEEIRTIKNPHLRGLVIKALKERCFYKKMGMIDPLTGIPNRRILSSINNSSVIVMCDIDNFKTINDQFGHTTGDNVIKAVATILCDSIRQSDQICRYGGDEFFIAFNNCNETSALARIEEIRARIENAAILSTFNVTLSIGMVVNLKGESLEALIAKADQALYHSKIEGKNKVSGYQHAIRHKK